MTIFDIIRGMRKQGILLHISSLPSDFMIGDLGESAYEFVDFLADKKQTHWQILPLNQTGFGDSPYTPVSSFANNPYFIDYYALVEKGLLKSSEIERQKTERKIDYSYLFLEKYKTLKLAYSRFSRDKKFQNYCKKNAYWLDDYAAFMTIKEMYDFASFDKFPSGFRFRQNLDCFMETNKDKLDFWRFLQYEFYIQWKKLKEYANKKHIKIIGDIPIYVGYDSVDVWANPNNFLLDDNLVPTVVAGVPPDAFSESGQLWGNPCYDWEYQKSNGYKYWLDRIKYSFEFFDVLRIDHFRGFADFFAIPYGESTAKNGKWMQGPSMQLFEQIENSLGKLDIIAEDLGILDDRAEKLLADTGYMGMKILHFAFGEQNSKYLPKNYPSNCVAYTGTHDNTTSKAFLKTLNSEEKKRLKDTIKAKNNKSDLVQLMIKSLIESRAELVIIPMQDYLRLGKSARMNYPSTTRGNWIFKLKKDYKEKFNYEN